MRLFLTYLVYILVIWICRGIYIFFLRLDFNFFLTVLSELSFAFPATISFRFRRKNSIQSNALSRSNNLDCSLHAHIVIFNWILFRSHSDPTRGRACCCRWTDSGRLRSSDARGTFRDKVGVVVVAVYLRYHRRNMGMSWHVDRLRSMHGELFKLCRSNRLPLDNHQNFISPGYSGIFLACRPCKPIQVSKAVHIYCLFIWCVCEFVCEWKSQWVNKNYIQRRVSLQKKNRF